MRTTLSMVETTSTSDTVHDKEVKDDSIIRPFHQNWWPVTTLEALDPSRPNVVELLGMKLVLYKSKPDDNDDNESSWTCLQDRCPHRFAPLSEGRVVMSSPDQMNKSSSCNIQCAYHGWEFGNDGSCVKIPQLDKGKIIQDNYNAKSYPIRIDCGMVFIWADPETANLGQLIPLPTFPQLQKNYERNGPSSCFMRDLPYGYELLGENLLDLSHLPFSHHSVASLKRDLGGPLPFKMLSMQEKSPDNPLYEAILEDASNTDPTFKSIPTTPKDATLNLGFYQPNHVRYTRVGRAESFVSLFFCPTSPTRSRVFLSNVFGPIIPSSPSVSTNNNNDTRQNNISIGKKINTWKNQKIQQIMRKLLFTPVFSHMLSHQIFDGDGIFLRMQGDRMKRENLTYKDYKTPSAADVLVNAFRRYVHVASELTKKADKYVMAESANSHSQYDDRLPRSQMLDRYESHTKHCTVCSAALKTKEKQKKFLFVAQTILNGSIGATSCILLMMIHLLLNSNSSSASSIKIPFSLIRLTTFALLSLIGMSMGLSKAMSINEKALKKFIFEDYIHAEKD